MPLIDHDSANAVEMFPGVVRRTMTAGERMMLVEVRLTPAPSSRCTRTRTSRQATSPLDVCDFASATKNAKWSPVTAG